MECLAALDALSLGMSRQRFGAGGIRLTVCRSCGVFAGARVLER